MLHVCVPSTMVFIYLGGGEMVSLICTTVQGEGPAELLHLKLFLVTRWCCDSLMLKLNAVRLSGGYHAEQLIVHDNYYL